MRRVTHLLGLGGGLFLPLWKQLSVLTANERTSLRHVWKTESLGALFFYCSPAAPKLQVTPDSLIPTLTASHVLHPVVTVGRQVHGVTGL